MLHRYLFVLNLYPCGPTMMMGDARLPITLILSQTPAYRSYETVPLTDRMLELTFRRIQRLTVVKDSNARLNINVTGAPEIQVITKTISTYFLSIS
jgi:hypothetical protein